MGVIPFPSWPVFSHLDKGGVNTVRRWLDQNRVSPSLRSGLQAQITLLEYSGPEVVQGVIVKVSGDFEAFKGVRKGEPNVYLTFCRGPFSDREITILVADHNPKNSLEEAKQNRRAVELDRMKRRAHERITR